MKIVVVGGSALIGTKVVACLREAGHEAVAASPDSGVNTLTGEGLADALVGASVVLVIEVAGPEELRFDDLVRQRLAADGDPRIVVADPKARYFGAQLPQRTLVAGDGARLGKTRFEDWLGQGVA